MSIAGTTGNRALSYLRAHTNPPVFLISAGVILAFLIVGAAFPESTKSAADATQDWIATYLGRFYILGATFFLVFAVAVMTSPWGRLRLGAADSRPQYGTWPWLAMVFTAGMGVGLAYAGVSEPAKHLRDAPLSVVDRQSGQAATEAMNFTFYHWGLHAWAMYTVLGLVLGYVCFRHDLPLRPSSVLYPLLGNRIHGWPGKLVDILTVSVTVFGLATSLGLGAQEINAGLNKPEMFGLPDNTGTTIVIAALLTAIAATALMLGIYRGLRRFSMLGLGLTALFLVFIFVLGPTLYILRGMADYTGFYLWNLPWTSVKVYDPQTTAGEWQAANTLFNWGWWLSWAPFVGMFIAKISHGRTIRQFIAGTLFVPAGVCLAWFIVLGGSTMFYEQQSADPTSAKIADLPGELAVFTLLDKLTPGVLSTLGGVVVIMLVVLFFGPSLGAGALVVDTITSRDDQEPVKVQRLGWVLSVGAVATVLLFVGGTQALEALRAAAIAAGLPIAVLLLIACGGLVKALLTARE